MKVNFKVRFHTQFGQSLSVRGNINQLGNNVPGEEKRMQYHNSEFWHTSIEVNPQEAAAITYSYMLTLSDGSTISEGERDRVIDINNKGVPEIQTIDTWNHEGAVENVFFTSPFKNILLPNNGKKPKVHTPKSFTHHFKVKAPLLKKNDVICLLGSGITLGDWKEENALLLEKAGDWWTVKVNIPQEAFPLEYKYCVYNLKGKKFLFMGGGANRHIQAYSSATITILHDGFVSMPNDTWKGAGIAIPVFSLRSNKSFGVGEFTDLKLLVDWARKTGLKLIQILPVNDTSATHTFADSYPYAAISAFALHPVYANLFKIAGKKDDRLVRSEKFVKIGVIKILCSARTIKFFQSR